MWPFKKQKPKEDGRKAAVDALKEFRDIGEKFNYMGIEMIVESHVDLVPYVGFVPTLTAAYRNNDGELKHACFRRSKLPALMAENP